MSSRLMAVAVFAVLLFGLASVGACQCDPGDIGTNRVGTDGSLVPLRDGDVLSGTVELVFTVSGDEPAVSIGVYLDRKLVVTLGSGVYRVKWDTTKTPNGTHLVYAVMRTGTGGATASPGAKVVVNNAPAAEPPADTAPPAQ